jgi:DMSO/TMAO reductase YedYZ molybdopterin-dependent catalytic subunit
MPQHFARSMALSDALDPRNLLCYETNGEELLSKRVEIGRRHEARKGERSGVTSPVIRPTCPVATGPYAERLRREQTVSGSAPDRSSARPR